MLQVKKGTQWGCASPLCGWTGAFSSLTLIYKMRHLEELIAKVC